MQQATIKVHENLPKLFIAGAVLGALSCFARADYNLPLYIFVYLMWDYDQNEKIKILALMAITFLVDFVWLCYWGPLWNSEALAEWEKGIHTFVLITSSLNFILKLVLMVCLCFVEKQAIKQNMPSNIAKFMPRQLQ